VEVVDERSWKGGRLCGLGREEGGSEPIRLGEEVEEERSMKGP